MNQHAKGTHGWMRESWKAHRSLISQSIWLTSPLWMVFAELQIKLMHLTDNNKNQACIYNNHQSGASESFTKGWDGLHRGSYKPHLQEASNPHSNPDWFNPDSRVNAPNPDSNLHSPPRLYRGIPIRIESNPHWTRIEVSRVNTAKDTGSRETEDHSVLLQDCGHAYTHPLPRTSFKVQMIH